MPNDRDRTQDETQTERDLREEQQRAAGGDRPRSLGGPEREATEIQREGMDLLGRSSVRDDAIPGVSDASARDDQRAETVSGSAAGAEGVRRNPPMREDGGGIGDGGLSASGGVAGGARGHGGTSDSMESPDAGGRPAQHKSTSRTDLDHANPGA